jgi:hypothetical protein
MPAAAGPDEMVEKAFDPKSDHDALEQAIAKLTPEEAQYFMEKLERALRKRKIQLTGYLVAMGVWLVSMIGALIFYGSSEPGTFVGWVFLLPFAAVALVLVGFGKWAERAGGADLPSARTRKT